MIHAEEERHDRRSGSRSARRRSPNGQYFGRITLDPKQDGANAVTIPVAFVKQQGAVTLTHTCSPTTFPTKTGVAHCIATVAEPQQRRRRRRRPDGHEPSTRARLDYTNVARAGDGDQDGDDGVAVERHALAGGSRRRSTRSRRRGDGPAAATCRCRCLRHRADRRRRRRHDHELQRADVLLRRRAVHARSASSRTATS